MAVRSTQGQNRAVRSTPGGGGCHPHASIEHRVLHKQRLFILADVLVSPFFVGTPYFERSRVHRRHVPLADGNAAPHHVPDDSLCFKSEQPHHLPLGSKKLCCMGDTNCEKGMTKHIVDSKTPC